MDDVIMGWVTAAFVVVVGHLQMELQEGGRTRSPSKIDDERRRKCIELYDEKTGHGHLRRRSSDG